MKQKQMYGHSDWSIKVFFGANPSFMNFASKNIPNTFEIHLSIFKVDIFYQNANLNIASYNYCD